MAIQWSEQQQAVFQFVETGRGSAVVEAVAGAGKTTTLVEAVKRMRGSVFVGAFNTKMAGELKKRVAGMTGVRAGTFHSAGYGLILKTWDQKPVTDGNKCRNLLQAHLDAIKSDHVDGLVTAVCKLVSLAKQSGFGVKGLNAAPQRSDWRALAEHHDLFDRLPEGYDTRFAVDFAIWLYQASLEQRDIIDFDDMILLPLYLNLRFYPNDWVLIDEAQDTNATRRLMAERMLRRGTGRLVAVGDPHQAIFGFTGADADSLDLIRRKFSATTLKLSVTYRCPRNVVAVARQYVNHITPAATAPEGEVQSMEYHEACKLMRPGSAVLCRLNKPLVKLCTQLIRDGVPAKIEGRDIGEQFVALAGRWKVKSLDALDGRLETYLQRELAKAEGDEAKQERISDIVETLRVLMARARSLGISTVDALRQMIRDMFGDVGEARNLVVLSSVHKSKGLEWPTVYLLGRRELMPSPWAKQDWQMGQERNLAYVAVTRAIETLIDVAVEPE